MAIPKILINNVDINDNIAKIKRFCLVGSFRNKFFVSQAVHSFDLDVVESKTGEEYCSNDNFYTIFILDEFHEQILDNLLAKCKCGQILGSNAIITLYNSGKKMSEKLDHPIYNFFLDGLEISCENIEDKHKRQQLEKMIKYMNGTVKQLDEKVDYFISDNAGNEKCYKAYLKKIPIVKSDWILDLWLNRHASFIINKKHSNYKLKTFQNVKLSFFGFPDEETKHLKDVLNENGGKAVDYQDPESRLVVIKDYIFINDSNNLIKSNMVPSKRLIYIKEEWFWTCVYKEIMLPEAEYTMIVQPTKIFQDLKICFLGFFEKEDVMKKILESHGGIFSTIEDTQCRIVVANESVIRHNPDFKNKVLVTSLWFWKSIEERCLCATSRFLLSTYLKIYNSVDQSCVYRVYYRANKLNKGKFEAIIPRFKYIIIN